MSRKVATWGGVLLLGALAFGVSGAGGRTLATTTVIVQVMGRGTVGGGGGQINCGDGSKSCYATYVFGASVTITATAPVGWTFSGWDDSADCSGTSNTCTVPLNGTIREETAEFTPVTSPGTSTLTVTPPDNGSVEGGDIDCGTDGEDCDWPDLITGSTVTLSEFPDTGYSFGGWGGGCTGTADHCTLTMDTDRTVSATFTQSAASHMLSVSVTGDGTVTGGGIACTSAGGSGCSASEAAGSQVALSATPGSGASFTGWGGACAGTATSCTVSMTADKSVTAAFSGGTGSTYPLTVSVTGSGKVTGGGIDCGNGATTCTANLAAGSSVTLTASPASGATFGGWGGACSGATTTCTVTMDAAKAVAATFQGAGAGPPPNTVALTLRVSGNGAVSGPGGACASSAGAKSCTQSYATGATVTLTAAPGARARFIGWSGACSGTRTTCSLTLDVAKTVNASFTAPSGGSADTALESRSRPLVTSGRIGFGVTLKFSASQQGLGHLSALRAGRVVAAFSFPVSPGLVTIGPFLVARSGYYTFRVTLRTHKVEWMTCLGRCGEAARAPRFTLTRREPIVVDAGAAWSVTIQFQASVATELQLRMYRGRTLAYASHFTRPPGRLSAGPFLLSPGSYTIRLTATDAYRRIRTLSWLAFLP